MNIASSGSALFFGCLFFLALGALEREIFENLLQNHIPTGPKTNAPIANAKPVETMKIRAIEEKALGANPKKQIPKNKPTMQILRISPKP